MAVHSTWYSAEVGAWGSGMSYTGSIRG